MTTSADVTDNLAVEYREISNWNQYLGQQVILRSISNAGTLSANWDTRSLTPAEYVVKAYAYDTLGNWMQTEITVNVGVTAKSLKVISMTLSGTISGSKAIITGYVYVKDSSGQAIQNANVAIRWTLPNRSTKTMNATTNSLGQAKFSLSSTRSTFTLTVTHVSKSSYLFDAAGNILSMSITK